MSTDLVPTDLDRDISVIAKRYRKAGGVGIQVLNLVGGQAENLLERLPDAVCVFRGDGPTGSDLMRPPISILSAHRFRGIRPPL